MRPDRETQGFITDKATVHRYNTVIDIVVTVLAILLAIGLLAYASSWA